MALLSNFNIALLLIDEIITRRNPLLEHIFLSANLLSQARNQLVDRSVYLGTVLNTTGNDQRRARFVNEDRIDLINNGKIQRPLDTILGAEGHVVSQIIKPELIVGAISNIDAVCFLFFLLALTGINHPRRHAESLVEWGHPFTAPLR